MTSKYTTKTATTYRVEYDLPEGNTLTHGTYADRTEACDEAVRKQYDPACPWLASGGRVRVVDTKTGKTTYTA